MDPENGIVFLIARPRSISRLGKLIIFRGNCLELRSHFRSLRAVNCEAEFRTISPRRTKNRVSGNFLCVETQEITIGIVVVDAKDYPSGRRITSRARATPAPQLHCSKGSYEFAPNSAAWLLKRTKHGGAN